MFRAAGAVPLAISSNGTAEQVAFGAELGQGRMARRPI
jgi:hypothetical protein